MVLVTEFELLPLTDLFSLISCSSWLTGQWHNANHWAIFVPCVWWIKCNDLPVNLFFWVFNTVYFFLHCFSSTFFDSLLVYVPSGIVQILYVSLFLGESKILSHLAWALVFQFFLILCLRIAILTGIGLCTEYWDQDSQYLLCYDQHTL